MRLFVPVLALGLLAGVQEASAQFSAQKDAQYIATLKAVVNYKINDEEKYNDTILACYRQWGGTL